MHPDSGGKGSYVSGEIWIPSTTKFFLYIGGKGQDQTSYLHGELVRSLGGWNGGGNAGIDTGDYNFSESGAGGGGAVDLRLVYYDMNKIDNTTSLFQKSIKSRIIVAGSGGGACSTNGTEINTHYRLYKGGNGGDLISKNVSDRSLGATQTFGNLGIGCTGKDYGVDIGGSSAGCGSGYRGGMDFTIFSTKWGTETSSAGGNSYISGYKGCMSPSPVEADMNSINSMFHFSGFYFHDGKMLDGQYPMPTSLNPKITTNGHSGNGEAAITYLGPLYPTGRIEYVQIHNMKIIQVFVFVFM